KRTKAAIRRLALRSRPHVARGAARGRNVTLLGVIHDHTVGVKAPAQGSDGALHALDPAPRKSITIAMVIKRDHFFAKRPQQVFSIAGVVNIQIGMRPASANGKPVHAVEGFGPPAVEDGKIQPAVQHYFLTARP